MSSLWSKMSWWQTITLTGWTIIILLGILAFVFWNKQLKYENIKRASENIGSSVKYSPEMEVKENDAGMRKWLCLAIAFFVFWIMKAIIAFIS